MAETDKIELGGNIELVGFKEVDPGSMVILKKMVGSYVKKFSETVEHFEKFSLSLINKENNELKAVLSYNANNHEANASGKNLFQALDQVMKQIEEKIKV